MNPVNEMSKLHTVPLRTAAITSAVGLLIMTVLAPFANFYVLQKLIVPGDATKTITNISAGAGLFRLAICSFVVVIICDVVVAWALYVLLKPANKNLSMLTAWFRLVYAAVFAVALNNCPDVARLTNDPRVFNGGELSGQVMRSLDAFRSGWDVGLVFFGVHLVLLGCLAFRSGYVPKIIGILLGVAGLGYFADSFGKLLLQNYSMMVSTFTFVGEPLFMFWLLWKGIKGFGGEVKGGN